MRYQLFISLAVISMLSLSSCSPSDPLLVQPVISATPSMILSSPQAIPDETVDTDLLNKPLPELDEIEALLAEYSGTDVK